MRLIAALLISIAGLFISPVFAENANSMPADNSQQTSDSQNQAQNQDNEIVGWLIVLNKNEIAAAKEVLKHKVSPSVKAYAQLMKKDHTKNLQDTLALSKKDNLKPADTDAVEALKQQGQQELANLKQQKGKQFEVAYITAMVQGHTDALKGLDDKIQAASNPDLKKHLEATRAKVQEHLNKANDVKNKLGE